MKPFNKKLNFFLLITFAASLLLFTALSCDTTEPPPPIDDQYLEYEWTIDTLKNPNDYGVVPWSIWGSSPQSVWIAGFNLAGQGEIFHWDGVGWDRVTPDLGFNYEVLAVFGFSENDVYAAGSRIIIDTVLHTQSLVLHYDGTTWQRENLPVGSGLKFIHGRNSNDVWACGIEGALYHKTGNQWSKIPFSEKKYLGLLSESPDLGPIYATPNGQVFLMNEYYNPKAYGDTAMFYFSKYSNGKWTDLDSCKLVNVDGIPRGYKFGNKAMWGVTENEIYSAGDAVYRYDGNNWSPVTWDDYSYLDLKITANERIFTVGWHGTIRYFNRNNWLRIPDFSSKIVDFYSIMPFEDEIFIGAYQLGIGYVVRGKLKK
ncbi:MAG: hypothetical protein K9J16_14825 [Melioribacteraceae bacterium]|nr:hypothetical protein [Melioribacteraceae bacterium]MCF8355815.1 hypothetical protein [Melioribacteraceae bacterium]MCF8395305.1 hypothetical protein [Melioribacteraceae bacterium]MCF8420753.1 hypothetical protein [Melioribacteraceae bacterium]